MDHVDQGVTNENSFKKTKLEVRCLKEFNLINQMLENNL